MNEDGRTLSHPYKTWSDRYNLQVRTIANLLVLLTTLAAMACAQAAELPDDLPLRDFALPRGSKLLNAEKVVTESDAAGQPPAETRWTLEFKTKDGWPVVGAHVTTIANIKNGMLPVAQESISGVDSEDLMFFSSDRTLSVRLHELAGSGGQPDKSGNYVFQLTVIEAAAAQPNPPTS